MESAKTQKNLIAILIVLFLVIVLSFVMVRFRGNSRNVTQEEIETLLAENDNNPESVKYLVTDNCISRVYPETNVETFVTNFSEGEVIKVYSDKDCTHQVTDGFVMSGMYAKYDENDRVFEISVLGDINEKNSKTNSDDILFGDGVLNQIELTRNIREAVKDEDWKIIEEVERKSADVNCNNLIDEKAVKTIINYIVFGNFKIDEIDLVKKPKIEVIQGTVDTNTVYRSDVVLRVTENEEDSLKTVYKITGDEKTGYKEILNNGEIVLKNDGLYKVTVYTYGKLENKSKAEYIIININKTAKYTMEYYLEGVDGNYTKVESDTKIAEGIIGDSVEIEGKLYTDYELDVDNELGNLKGNIAEDGKLVLKAYYSRKKYTYTFTADDNIESVIVEQGRTEQKSTEQGSARQSNTEQDNSKQESIKQSQIGKTVKVTQKWGEKITINAELKTETGYEIIWDCWQNVNNENDKISDITKEIEIAKENREYKATAQKKIIDYTIKYELSGGKLVEGETNPVKYNIETEAFTLKNPSKPGYVFTGWTGTQLEDKSTIVTVSSGSTGNREYTANYLPISDTPYKVEHYKETLETGKYKLAETENLGGETDSTVKAVEKMYNGFTYDTNNENAISEGKITADGNLVLKLYYKRNIYNLTVAAGENIFEVSSEGILTKTTLTTPYKYEQEVKINATLENKIGYTYTWTKWVSSNPKAISDITEKNKLLKMPAQDITLTATAQKIINTYEYKIEYYYDNMLEPTKTQTKSGKYGDVISIFSDENIMGYELEKQENIPLTITENENNNIIKIYYKQKEYFIKYDLKDGKIGDGETESEKTNPEKYTIKSEDITLDNPTKIGYNFTGWTGGVVDNQGNIIQNPTQSQTGKTGNTIAETKKLTIQKGSLGNRKYTANWQKLSYEVIVHHYLQGTGPKYNNDPVLLAEDEIFTSKLLGEKYTTDDLIPTYDENGNIIETDGRSYLDGTELYVSENPENATGTFTSEPIEVTYYYQYYPVVKIVSSPAEELNGTEYITIKKAIQALQNKGLTSKSEISKLQILRNVKNENVVIENKNLQIDLSNFTINSKSKTEPTIKLNNSKLNVVDESESEQGKIVSENASGIYIKTNSEFTLGLEEKPVKPTPEIIAKTKGVEKEIVDNKQGIFNFFDGKITAVNAIDGIVDLTPILYNATVTTNEQGQQLSILQIVSNVEARIGRKTYLKLEDAIADVGTEYGIDGSQVEVTIVKDLTKEKEVVIDASKNVLLDLNGCVVTATGSNYVFNNNGKLEIIDRTSQDIIKIDSLTPNGTYYFEKNEDGSFTSNNKGVSGVANSYATIDLTEYEGTYIVSLQAEICGYSNYGYATITKTTNAPVYNATSGRLIYMTDIVGREYFEKELQGGSVYYLHLGYKKDDNSKLFDDEFKINDIKVIKKTTGKVSPGTAGSIKNSSTGEFVLTSGNLTPSLSGAVENYGTCRIDGGRIVGNNYGVMNKDSGNLIVKGGLIKTSSRNAISACGENTTIEGGIIQSDGAAIIISDDRSAENFVINNGIISSTNGVCISNYSTNPVIINNGYIGGSDTCIYSVGRKFEN